MHSFDRANFLLTLGLVFGIFCLIILGKLLMYFERRGWVRLRGSYRPSSGVGNCFLAVEILGKPQMQYVAHAKQNVRKPNRRKLRGGARPSPNSSDPKSEPTHREETEKEHE
jgi:hypothetical protein